MATAGDSRPTVCMAILFITVSGFRATCAGTPGSVCDTRVESLDLGCLLRWDCPQARSNTRFTVQTKTQGAPWQDVPWCVWISSHSCDVSQVFSNFELYNMIRLGVHLNLSATIWTKPCKFDYSDFTFSPPSVSIFLKEQQLLVKVQFPCAPNRRCSMEHCCPVSQLIDPWTTVTVYNRLNLSEQQSRTVWSQELVSFVEFSSLSPGKNYCIVANFSFPTFSMAASPKSAPQCVETPSESGQLPVVYLGIGLTFLLIFPFLTACRPKPRRDAADAQNRPKILAPLQDPVSLAPVSTAPVDPCDIHLELADDRDAIDSSMDDPSSRAAASVLVHTGSGKAARRYTAYWDSGGRECGPDFGISVQNPSQSSVEVYDK